MDPENQNPITQPVEQVAPVAPTHKTNWPMNFLMLIAGILIGAGGFWGYQNYLLKYTATPLASPQPSAEAGDPTANWKTYTSTKYGYSIKYPEIWVFKEGVEGPEFAPSQDLFSVSNSEVFSPVSVWVKASDNFDLSRESLNRYEEIPVVIGGIETKRVTGIHKATGERITGVKFTYNNHIFVIVTFGDKYIQTFDQMLPTFKFLQTTKLKTYYEQILDLSFQYPADWKIKTGSYSGDIALDGEGTCNYIKSSFSGYLKNPGTCSDSTIKSFSPGLIITSPDGLNSLEFAGPTSGLGGGCPDCVQNAPKVFTVNGINYTINTVSDPSANIKFETLIGPYPVGILAGAKSIWTKFDIGLKAMDQSNFDTEIKILESIKYTSQ